MIESLTGTEEWIVPNQCILNMYVELYLSVYKFKTVHCFDTLPGVKNYYKYGWVETPARKSHLQLILVKYNI
jgi:hypothetical protein